MAELSMFIVERELAGILRRYAERREMDALSFVDNEYEPLDPERLEEKLSGRKRVTALYLYPKSHPPARRPTDQTARPREWGWTSVQPGRIVTRSGEKILTMSTLQAEDRQGLPFRPAGWLRQLKKGLVGELVFGVQGVNRATGGRSTYRDIAWSAEASRLFKSGVLWKQHPDYNVVFEPLETG